MSLFNDQARIMIGGRRSSLGGISSGFHGTISGFVFNGMRILDLLTEGDPRVRMEGDVTLLEQPLPKSPPAHEGGNVVYNNGMQSTQGVKRKLYKRSLVSENSSRSKPKSSNKRSSTFYLQYKNKIKDLEAFEEFLTIMENDIAKKKSSAVGLPPPVVQNHAQKTFHKRKHSKTSLGPSYDILSKSDSRDEKDHVLDGNIESIYSSGDHGMVANDDTNLESSGFSILTLESFPTDDESLLVNKTKDWKGRMNKFIKSFTMFLPSTDKQQTGDHLSSVKVGTSRNQPFARANSRVGRIYPIDRGKHHSNSKRRKTLLKKKKLTNRIHSKSTTPRQVTDDIISSSGDGPDCYSDDEDECIVTPSEDDIITPAIVITKAEPPRRPKNVTCVDDCPTPIGTELFPMLEKNKTLVLPPRGTTSPNGMTTERSEPSAKKSPGDSGHLNIFLIIGIVAGVLVALIILLIAFYKFRRSDEGSYRVDESQNFAYLEAKKQQSNGTSGGSVGNGKAGGKKKDVKEWYV
ncbi:Neurexin-2 [Mactra antiquata]